MFKKIVILVSNIGTGTNMMAILREVKKGKIKAEVVAVISDTQDSIPLKKARSLKLPTILNPKKEDLLKVLKSLEPDFICLAGWKQIITDEVIGSFPNKILNAHPGIIPDRLDRDLKNPDGTLAVWNKGKMTNKAIQNILDLKSTYAGTTIHFLSKEFDFGKVLGRAFEKVKKGDSAESLYKRLKVKENALYIQCLSKLCRQ